MCLDNDCARREREVCLQLHVNLLTLLALFFSTILHTSFLPFSSLNILRWRSIFSTFILRIYNVCKFTAHLLDVSCVKWNHYIVSKFIITWRLLSLGSAWMQVVFLSFFLFFCVYYQEVEINLELNTVILSLKYRRLPAFITSLMFSPVYPWFYNTDTLSFLSQESEINSTNQNY